MWDLFKVKDVNYNLHNNSNVCLYHCQTKKYGLEFLRRGAQANYGTCYQMKLMNIILGNYKAEGIMNVQLMCRYGVRQVG